MVRRGWWWAATGGAALLLAFLALAELAREERRCGLDTSYCGFADRGTERHRGRLFTVEGRPMPTRIEWTLRSLEERTRTFATDAQGRYCLDFVRERVTPYPEPQVRASTLPVDARFRSAEGQAGLAVAHARGLRHVTLGPYRPSGRPPDNALEAVAAGGFWREEVDGATPCESPGRLAPWYRYDDLEGSWQGRLLKLLPLGGAVLVLLLAATPLRRARRRWLIPGFGFALAAVEVALAALLWQSL